MKECYLYEKLPDKKVRCKTCSHYCLIKNNSFGLCGVRKNIEGKLYSLVYGKIIALNLDPIEKKPLFHFLPNSLALSLGTVGCNFRCLFCQNYDISQITREDYCQEFGEKRRIIGQEISKEKIVEIAKESGAKSIAYTYNEPAVFFEFAFDTAKLAKENNLKNIFVSNGFESKELIEEILPFLDAVNFDLKSFSEKFYQQICGGRLAPVLENIERVFKSGVWLEITTLIIPGYNDSEKELRQIARFIKNLSPEIPWHLSRFYPAFKMSEIPPTPIEKLIRAYQIGKEEGLFYVYLGNVSLPEKETTYCPKCLQPVIKRDYYQGKIENFLQNGRCPHCQEKIAGIFE